MEFLNKKVAILFSSFSRNQDLLPIAYYYLNKNLKINLNIFWGSNGDIIHDFHKIAPNWNYIRTHNVDLGWSQNLIEYLKHISTEYILLMLDDFIILKKPNVELIKEGFKLMIDKNAIYFRLNNNPPPTKKINENFGFIEYWNDYRSSLQPSIWKKEILLEILKKYQFNPWKFEWKAGIMKETINKCFIGCYNDLIKVDHIIEKGKIREKYYKVYLKFNNFNKREIYFDKEIKSNISLKEKILKKISPRILWHLRKFLKKGIFSENFNGY